MVDCVRPSKLHKENQPIVQWDMRMNQPLPADLRPIAGDPKNMDG